ncbi:MAG: hypothetical protein AB8B48_19635 [Pseudomonadales bacterium]
MKFQTFAKKALHPVALATCFVALPSQAGLITFEDLAGSPVGTVVNSQYSASDGVTFSSSPILGDVGNSIEGWKRGDGANDSFRAGQGANNGQYFISDVLGLNNTGSSTLIVDYASAVDGLSFDLFDIDANETYVINVYDDANNLLRTASIAAGDAGTGDGMVTRIGLSAVGIRQLEVLGTRTRSGGFGLGFDNFNTSTNDTTVPNPSSVFLVFAALAGLRFAKSRR